jgi:glycosyltransferase involved in cell wall biosynthesis
VFVRYNRIADIGEYLPIDYLRPHRKSSLIEREGQPDNVTVVPLPLWYLPIDSHYQQMGEKHYSKAVGLIESRDVTFDLVHAHFTWSSGYVAARLGEAFDVPSVLTVHENENWLREQYENGHDGIYETWRSIDAIIRVNEKDVPLFEEFNDDVHSIPNGFSRDDFPNIGYDEAREALGLSPDAKLVFGLGVLEERKRFHHLIGAAETLRDQFEDLSCVVAGGGPDKGRLRRLTRRKGLDDVVSITGRLPQDEVATWMNAADLFVLPSEAEGNPTVMFEALGCGTPYVGTNAGGVEEIITSEEYGLTYPVDEPEQLPGLVERGLRREWDRELIREYGEQFTWERITDQTVEVYPNVVHERPVRSREDGSDASEAD